MSDISFQPRFGSDLAVTTANLIRQIRDENKHERQAKQREAEIRQQVLQELQDKYTFQPRVTPNQPIR